ncbi:MAG: hypothetical protein WA406_15005 [Pseudolabrys sp.]
MKPTVLAAFGALIIMLSADVGQLYRQNGSPADICNNCTTLDLTESVPSDGERAVETKSTIAAVRHPSLALDANGNPTGVIVSAKTGARARVGRTYAARFQA